MKSTDPENSAIALGLRRIDIRTTWRTCINTDQPGSELRLAKIYWLKTIQPYIAGRKLRGAEWYIASMQHCHLRGAADYANRWNETDEGKKHPVPAEEFPDWEKSEFQEPEQLLADKDLKPEILAGIAANLLKPGKHIKSPIEAVNDAYELLIAAKNFIEGLPKHPQSRDPGEYFDELIKLDFVKVTFEEILQSNEVNSGCLPLLPPVQRKRNEGRLTMSALKIAVRRFLQAHKTQISKDEFEREERESEARLQKNKEAHEKDKSVPKIFRGGSGKKLTYQEWLKLNQDSVDDILNNHRISANLIEVLRWERFKYHWQHQLNRTQKRNIAIIGTSSATSNHLA